MTQEEKAKAYDDLLVKLQKAKVDNDVCDERYCCVINSIVPELKESEDRIRKALIKFHKSTIDIDGIKGEDILAWLEEQGEKGTNGNEREIPNFAWNEEDEEMLNSFLHKLEVCDLLSNKESIWIKNKLKPLRPQAHWKPSDEQIEAVKCAALDVSKFSSRSKQLRLENEPYYKALISLCQDLKKLREKKL